MIDPRELMLGNLIYVGESEQIEVSEIGKDYVRDQNGVICFSFDPIPITEEWLENFGFNRNAENRYYIFFKDRVLFGYWLFEASIIIEGTLMPFKINNVHQLQKLYFALTGEELQLKETIKQK